MPENEQGTEMKFSNESEGFENINQIESLWFGLSFILPFSFKLEQR